MPAVTFPPYRERKTGSQRRRPGPRRVTLIQLDTSLNLREKRPGVLLAEAGHPFAQAGLRHLVERVLLFDGHIGGKATLYAPGPHVAPGGVAVGRHRETSKVGKRSRQAWIMQGHVLRRAIFNARNSLAPYVTVIKQLFVCWRMYG